MKQHLLPPFSFAGRIVACLVAVLSVVTGDAVAQVSSLGYYNFYEWFGHQGPNEAFEPDFGINRKSHTTEDASATKWYNSHKNDAEVEMVDMGLSVLWASYNVGATRLDAVGDIFAWGETKPKAANKSNEKGESAYTWSNYKWKKGKQCAKYNDADGKTRLEPADDAATANMGGNWRTPSKEEWAELFDRRNCNVYAINRLQPDNSYEVAGLVIESKITEGRIFLPLSLYWTADLGMLPIEDFKLPRDFYHHYHPQDFYITNETYCENYENRLTSICTEAVDGSCEGAFDLEDLRLRQDENYAFFVGPRNMYVYGLRSAGMQVRAVCPNPNYKKPDAPVEHMGAVAEAVDMGLSVMWSSWNLGADSIGKPGKRFILGENKPNGYNGHWIYDWASYFSVTNSRDKDAIREQWGDGWRLPSNQEWNELQDPKLCTWTMVDNGEEKAWQVTSRITGNSILLPWVFFGSRYRTDGVESRLDADYAIVNGRQCGIISRKERWLDAYFRPVMPYADGQQHVATAHEKSKATVEPVDLGLSVCWSSHNVGALEGAYEGDFFSWGETSAKENYEKDTYKGPKRWHLTKVSNRKYVLNPEVDAAHVNIGGDWRMPTEAEWNELLFPVFCKWEWTYNYNDTGESGYVVTSRMNGNSIFLPSTGCVFGDRRNVYQAQNIFYWLREDDSSFSGESYVFAYGQPIDWSIQNYIDENKIPFSNAIDDRALGLQVRAVSPNPDFGKSETQKPMAMHEAEAVDLGLSVLWASCNVGSEDGIGAGDYYAYGATAPYSFDNRKPAKVDEGIYQKAKKGTCTLLPQADAASANMGGDWRMPTQAEWEELADERLCSWEKTWDYNGTGISGYIVTSLINGNSIFLPAAGRANMSECKLYSPDYLIYWSSSYLPGYERAANFEAYAGDNRDRDYTPKCDRTRTNYGLQIRAVRPRP